MNKKPIKLLVLIITIALCTVSCSADDSAYEWIGNVTAVVGNPGNGNAMEIMVLKDQDGKNHILLTDPDVKVEGIEKRSNSIAWRLGDKYHVIGQYQKNKQELEVAKKLGYESIVIASSIKWLEKNYGQELLSAASKGNVDGVIEAINRGADINYQNNVGDSALHIAAAWGKMEVANTLIDKGANINLVNQYGLTPLHSALVFTNYEVMAPILINAGADLTIRNNEGQSPLDVAQSRGRKGLAEIIRNKMRQ